MTVIKPNAIAGINSITVASGAALAIHKADGTLIQTLSGAAGVSTFTSISVGSAATSNSSAKSINIGLGASISQHNDNALTFGTNGDPRITIDASGNFNVGSAATIKSGGNATFSGIVTAASFIGDGSGLTGAGPSLTGSTNNTIVTVTGANAIQGESNLTFDGSALAYSAGGAERLNIAHTSGGTVALKNPSNAALTFGTNNTERIRILAGGGVGIGTEVPDFEFTVADMTGAAVIRAKDGANNKIVDLIANSTGGLLRTIGSYPLVLNTNQTERFRVGTSGQLGVGGANYGTSGQVLTSGGASSAVSWATVSAGIEMAQHFRLTSSSQGNQSPLTNWEAADNSFAGSLGSSMSVSSGVFTYPSTGIYFCLFTLVGYSDSSTQNLIGFIEQTIDGGSNWGNVAYGLNGIYDFSNSYPSWANTATHYIFDITDTSQQKTRFGYGAGQGPEYVKGDTNITYTGVTFIRLGDT